MRTLIFNGSPRKDGDTAALIYALCSRLHGEIFTVNAYYDGISPCTDCRFCIKNSGCAINDKMTDVYEQIKASDNIVIASPIFFSELTGPLLSVMSRLQTLFCAVHFRGEKREQILKRGAVILTGGNALGSQKAENTAQILLKAMGAADIFPPVCCKNTDTLPAAKNAAALEDMERIAIFFNGGCRI